MNKLENEIHLFKIALSAGGREVAALRGCVREFADYSLSCRSQSTRRYCMEVRRHCMEVQLEVQDEQVKVQQAVVVQAVAQRK